MFTGLIRHLGVLRGLSAQRIVIECPTLFDSLAAGDSVAVNGVCLTVADLSRSGFSAELLPATISTTTLHQLTPGRRVNLELPLGASGRFDGHFVQGHVDGITSLTSKQQQPGQTWEYTFDLPAWLEALVFEKCSIAIDGVSLTVQNIQHAQFGVALVPTTYNGTALSDIPVGGGVNVEADMLVKAVQHVVLAVGPMQRALTLNDLKELGYGA